MARIFHRVLTTCVAVASVYVPSVMGDQKKLTNDQRMEILRGLSAEYATVKVPLPRSRAPLDVKTDGTYDKQQWTALSKQLGPAGRVGDLVQVTRVEIEKDSIILQINGGMRNKSAWKDHLSIGMNGASNPVNGGQPTNAPGGTTVALRFGEPIGEITSAEIKKMLQPVLDFNQQSATEQYVETLTPEVKKAVADKKAIVGMDRDQVILAVGKPVRKVRETKDGVDYEDWVYGEPPGRVTFVTFSGAKVVKVKETYAGLGGTIADPPKQQ
jgi:hypothetical protein